MDKFISSLIILAVSLATLAMPHTIHAATLTVTNCIVSNNIPDGIINIGVLDMTRSTVSNNTGRGVQNLRSSFITNSTFSGNTVDGIAVQEGNLALLNSTVSGNIRYGVDIQSNVASADLRNTIVAGNQTADCHNFFNGISSLGYNLLGADNGCPADGIGDLTVEPDAVFATVLGPLQNNGGPTETHALLPGSLSIDAIPIENCVDPDGAPITTDQRGLSRPQGPACDIGAYEWDGSIIDVEIDIIPGRYPNRINLHSKEKVPVAIPKPPSRAIPMMD